jgi:hypothetical protein
MQPAFAIPPLTEQDAQRLVGQRCSVPTVVATVPPQRWWVTITAVRWITETLTLCNVTADHHRFGRERWVFLKDCRWRNHIDDPLLQAIVKARGEAKK